MFLLFLRVFKALLSFPCVLILKFLSLVFLGVFPPKCSKIRSIRSKKFKSCAILLFFSFLLKIKNIFSLYFKNKFSKYISKIQIFILKFKTFFSKSSYPFQNFLTTFSLFIFRKPSPIIFQIFLIN